MHLRTLLASVACSWVLAGPAGAAPEARRFALLIASDVGDLHEPRLRYAEADARRVASILGRVGDFAADDVTLLLRPSLTAVVHALEALEQRIAESGEGSLLMVFYSGHADAESIHLAGARFPLADLRAYVSRTQADARVLVVDACRSGVVTRVKGGRPGPRFDVRFEAPVGARGYAILTSSAAGEEAQESDELKASFFTHYFASALLGAADRDQDGAITVEEAFGYAADRTLVATAATVPGPQHPTYRFDLSGRERLVLTRPGVNRAGHGVLELPRAGWFLVRRSGGPVIAEAHVDASGRRLALETGVYRVTLRERDHYLEGDVTVPAGEVTRVPLERFARQRYTPVARKGAGPGAIELVRAPVAQSWKPVYTAGVTLFAVSHLFGTMVSMASFFTNGYPTVEGPLSMAPIVGPLAAYGYRAHFGPNLPVGQAPGPYDAGMLHAMGGAYVAAALVQAVGLGLTIAGDVKRRRSLRDRGLVLAPAAGGFYLGLGGGF